MEFFYNFVEVFSEPRITDFSINSNIQFVVWIIYGIKNIMKMNYNSICSCFYIVF